jgi:hypothetical protein
MRVTLANVTVVNPSPDAGRANAEGKTSLYRVAYEEALRTLEDQRDELNGVRGRAVQFLAFVGSATAFLAGTGLASSTVQERGALFYTIGVIATLVSVGTVASCAIVLNPRWTFNLRISATVLIDQWIDREVPGPTEPELLKALAQRLDGMRAENEAPLKALRRWFLTLIICGGLSVILWAALVWLNG